MGDTCIAIYVIHIRSIINASPPLGIVAKASGRAKAIIACEPATKVPITNIKENITAGCIGNFSKYSGNLSITPVKVRSSLNTIIITVLTINFVSKAVFIIGISSSTENLFSIAETIITGTTAIYTGIFIVNIIIMVTAIGHKLMTRLSISSFLFFD